MGRPNAPSHGILLCPGACAFGLVALAACVSHKVSGLPAQIHRPVAVERVEAWREDLAALARELRARHAAPFGVISEAAFDAEVAALHERIPSLDDGGVVIELGRLAAAIGDGHTGFELWGPRLGLRAGPLAMLCLADGVFVKGVVGDVGADVDPARPFAELCRQVFEELDREPARQR